MGEFILKCKYQRPMLLLVAMILLLLVVVVVVGGANWFGGIGTGVLQGKTTVARSGTVNNMLLSH
jgi:hypothetical protein